MVHFWQLKIPPSNGVHSVDALVLYGSTIYSVRGVLFDGIKSKQNHTAADIFLNYLRYFTMIESMVGFPLLPPPHLLSSFFVNTLISRTLDIKVFTNLKL